MLTTGALSLTPSLFSDLGFADVGRDVACPSNTPYALAVVVLSSHCHRVRMPHWVLSHQPPLTCRHSSRVLRSHHSRHNKPFRLEVLRPWAALLSRTGR